MTADPPLSLVPTPCAVIDERILDVCIARTAALARGAGLALRPHAKTHKSVRIARRQREAGAVGLTVATVSEAEVFADAGIEDLFIAYPLWVDSGRAERLASVLRRALVRVGIDSADSARQLATALARTDAPLRRLSVAIEVDSGHHRSGVAPEAAGDVAAAARSAGLDVAGVFTFPGHSYAPEGRRRAADDEAAALASAVASLTRVGVDARVVSGGSTPSAAFADAGVLTELRPGVSALGDAQQWELGVCGPQDLAFTVLSTVVSRSTDHVIADAGSKVLGTDRAGYSSGYGRLPEYPEARITALSEHHATITGLDVAPGTRLRIAPNHVCIAVNLADEFVVLGADGDIERWPVDARGCNT